MKTEEVLSILRKQYATSRDQAEKDRIVFMANELKKGKHFGSEDKGGNGLCYECFVKPARPNHWNCDECSRRGTKKVVEIMAMQKAIMGMAQDVAINQPKTIESMNESEITEIFAKGGE
jgi:hypothetical protein